MPDVSSSGSTGETPRNGSAFPPRLNGSTPVDQARRRGMVATPTPSDPNSRTTMHGFRSTGAGGQRGDGGGDRPCGQTVEHVAFDCAPAHCGTAIAKVAAATNVERLNPRYTTLTPGSGPARRLWALPRVPSWTPSHRGCSRCAALGAWVPRPSEPRRVDRRDPADPGGGRDSWTGQRHRRVSDDA